VKETLTLNMGPQHPSTHGVLRLVLELDGERVIRATPHIGYLHRGVEKLAEYRTYEQFLPFTDRLDYVSATTTNLAYVQAVEKLAGITVPDRARYLRTIMAELSRISSHLIWYGTHALDLGAMAPMFFAFRERERVWDLFEAVCGARMTHAYLRIGGVRSDVPDETLSMIRDFVPYFSTKVDDYETLLTKHPIFRVRTMGVGALSARDAVDWGLTGPVLRASGVKWDLRKDEPYAAYGELDFDVPVGTNGDVYDRYLVRMAEFRQSLRIISQALDKMPGGPVRSDDRRFIRPPKEQARERMEDMVRYFYLAAEGPPMPEGEAYAAVDGPKGEVGFYIQSDGSSRPSRLKIRPPSFVHLSALPSMVVGQYLADVVAIIGSIDIVLGEVDR
jgi:NADH-quinone oxidoreductase subunit D